MFWETYKNYNFSGLWMEVSQEVRHYVDILRQPTNIFRDTGIFVAPIQKNPESEIEKQKGKLIILSKWLVELASAE